MPPCCLGQRVSVKVFMLIRKTEAIDRDAAPFVPSTFTVRKFRIEWIVCVGLSNGGDWMKLGRKTVSSHLSVALRPYGRRFV